MKKYSLVNRKSEDYFNMIGYRLKEERERLGFTQQEISEKVNISKRTFIDWEKGKTTPTATQLVALSAVGADILYIVIGQHSQAFITPEEQVILEAYRKLPEENKKHLMVLALTGIDISTKKKKGKANTKVSIKGSNNTGNIMGGKHKISN